MVEQTSIGEICRSATRNKHTNT